MSAKKFLNPETEEYFRASSEQITISKWRKENLWEEILNEKGLNLFYSTCEKVEKGEYKDEIEGYCFLPLDSGSWYADFGNKKAKFFMEISYDTGLTGMMTTKFNASIGGYFKNAREKKVTSCCIFIVHPQNENPGWCLTMNGTIYKIAPKTD